MKTLQERMNEFCLYHRDGDGECNAKLLAEYAKRHELSDDERFHLAFFFSVTYCCESGIILFKNRERLLSGELSFETLKRDMVFQSDRKYIKMGNRFNGVLKLWINSISSYDNSKWFNGGVLDLHTAIKDVEKWYMFGRFSAFLFLESYATMIGVAVSNTTIDWKHGDTATSGLLNLFGDDAIADEFDRSGVLKVPVDKMDARLSNLAKNVEKTGGDTDTTKLETSLCAYRKFYKGTRYNGYYLDRMLEELVWYQRLKPEYSDLTSELYGIRRALFPDEMLGELHGWTGIRKENKKLYMMYGII